MIVCMGIDFEDEALRALCELGIAVNRKYTKYRDNKLFMDKLSTQLSRIRDASSFDELARISPLHYERLRHEFSGYTSFTIGNMFVERVICKENKEGIKLILLTLDDTHYGNKK